MANNYYNYILFVVALILEPFIIMELMMLFYVFSLENNINRFIVVSLCWACVRKTVYVDLKQKRLNPL
jgi:hypothetical protein